MIARPRPAQVARFVADFAQGFGFVSAAMMLFFIAVTQP